MDKPLSAPFGWMGGKSRLRAKLAVLIPEQDKPLRERKLQRYVEVFGGGLLLYKLLKDSKATWVPSYGDNAPVREL